MPQTPNHDYNVPNEGAQDWHVPLNENFRQYDTDIEIRDTAGNRGDYEPKDGAKFLATDTGMVFVGDGNEWVPRLVSPGYDPADSGSVTLSVDGTRVLSLGGESGGNAGNVVAGHSSNSVVAEVVGATIAGGGLDSGSATEPNVVYDNYGTVGGGQDNQAGADDDDPTAAEHATVGGGFSNATTGQYATIGGGAANEASEESSTAGGGSSNVASGVESTVGGGRNNVASETGSTVGGGKSNFATGQNSTVGGGTGNEAIGLTSTIGGGDANEAIAADATVGGGISNVASGEGATVPGGEGNEAQSAHSFAAGRDATAAAPGAFVWGDSSDQNVVSNQANEFKVQAGGGAILYSSSALDAGVNLAPGDGTWSSISTRTAKTNVSPTEPEAVLERVEDLEVSTWEYNSAQDATHMGPMAEEFYDAFGLGADEECIANVDADGVALAAIQGLSARLEQRDDRIDAQTERIEDLESENERLAAENDELRERLAALEDRVADIETDAVPGAQ